MKHGSGTRGPRRSAAAAGRGAGKSPPRPTRAPQTRPRKLPRQDRAAETVDAILAAAARLIVQEGYAKATTNRVAEVAGVSIGSLYQYFPNKEALLSALWRRYCAQMAESLQGKLAASAAAPLPLAARELVRAELAAHAAQPRLYSTLYEVMPRLGAAGPMEEDQRRMVARLREQLAARPEALRPADLEMAAFLIFHAVRGVSQAALRLRPEYLADPLFLDECAALVLRFLGPDETKM